MSKYALHTPHLFKKKVNYLSFLILLVGILFISGCVSQNGSNQSGPKTPVQPTQGLQIVLKDPGMPEVKYLQPTIKEVQLQNEGGRWVTIWSSPEGKTVKLTSDGAEMVLDTVSVEAGTYVGTRLLVSTIDVEVDINRDGDTLDKNVEVVLTLEEFERLPQKEKPSAPQPPERPQAPEKPQPPEQPQAPEEPEAPQKPQAPVGGGQQSQEKPQAPQQPPEPQAPQAPGGGGQQAPQEPSPPYRIEGGLVYTGNYLDEKHTVTLNDYIVPLGEQMWKTNFVYGGSGGKIIYDFTLHPLEQKGKQISVEVFTTTTSNITVPPTTVLFDDFNGATNGTGFGALTYEDSLPNLGKAVNLVKGTYIKYSFPPWYKWDGAHNWNRNEASPGVLTEGSAGMWIKPRQYTGISIGERGKPSGILTFNWGDSESATESGYIMHLGFTADGKLTYSVWGGNLDNVLVGKTTIPLNKWSHVAVSWGPDGTKLYVNAKEDASTSANVWPAFSGTVFAYLNYWGANDLGLVDDLYISNVAVPPPPIIITENATENVTANITANVTADVKISSLTCDWTAKFGDYGVKSDCVRIIAKGTAQGPVGARVELPLLGWSDDKFDCGAWTHKTGALIAVGHTCVRKEGQPETTNWTVDTEGDDCPLKNDFNNNRSYSVKIYKNDNLDPEKEDRKNTLCQ
jgi:hypothetical protein